MRIRDCIKQLEPYGYIPGNKEIAKEYGLEPSDVKRFDRNTPSCVLRSVQEELMKIATEGALGVANEYPDPRYCELTSLVAGYVGAEPGQIVLGNGADEIIDMLAKTCIEQEDIVAIPTPTFSYYKVAISSFGGSIIEVPREESNFSVDVEKLIRVANSRNAKMIFLCNPNSPAPNYTSIVDLERIANDFQGFLVIDEAYIEFSGKEGAKDLCNQYENVIVIGTLSKSFALAGQRVGYAVCSQRIAKELNKIRQPYNIDSITERLAIAALKNMEEMRENVEAIINERNRLAEGLEKLGFYVYPSLTNFLLVKTIPEDSRIVYEKLLRRGLVLRRLDEGLRITVRSKKDNDLLLDEIKRMPDGIIFDIDGVLVDVSRSYREAIKQTVKVIAGKDVTDSDIEAIKKLPNSNNDWDVTYALINGIADLKGIDRNAELYLAVKKKFQELYLGGLRDREKIMVSMETFDWLKKQGYRLGIVTSRPRDEALCALRQFIPEFFSEDCIIALEDCDAEKPNPNPLLLAKERMGCRAAVYVGDTINDVLAAKAADMFFVSVREDLEADCRIENVNKIIEVLK
jgi:histidinol-phosphate aminotransferase